MAFRAIAILKKGSEIVALRLAHIPSIRLGQTQVKDVPIRQAAALLEKEPCTNMTVEHTSVTSLECSLDRFPSYNFSTGYTSNNGVQVLAKTDEPTPRYFILNTQGVIALATANEIYNSRLNKLVNAKFRSNEERFKNPFIQGIKGEIPVIKAPVMATKQEPKSILTYTEFNCKGKVRQAFGNFYTKYYVWTSDEAITPGVYPEQDDPGCDPTLSIHVVVEGVILKSATATPTPQHINQMLNNLAHLEDISINVLEQQLGLSLRDLIDSDEGKGEVYNYELKHQPCAEGHEFTLEFDYDGDQAALNNLTDI